MGIAFHAGLRLGSGCSLTIRNTGDFIALHPSEITDNDRLSSMRQQRIRFASFVKNRAEKSANGGAHSTNSRNGVPVARVAEQMDVGATSVTTARAILKAAPEVAADGKAGKISLNEGAKRASNLGKSS